MKKFTILILFSGMAALTYAQNIPTVNTGSVNHIGQAEYVRPVDGPVLPAIPAPYVPNDILLAPNETKLGETWYDLQSNSSIANRFWRYEDGTMAAVWTRGMEATAFADRGTAYNYYDGTAWGEWPTERIEDRRCGWPSYAAWGADGEVSVAHNGEEGLEFSWRSTRGTGAWTQQNFLGPAGIENDITWPRLITTGDNHEIVHLFVNSYVEYGGQPTALLYSRSDDGGASWDPHHIVLDGMGPEDYFEIGADDYTMAAQGSTVVMLVASPWQDLFFMRSDDDGEEWEKTIVWEHPYPLWDWNTTIADSFFCCDGSGTIDIGPDGKVHVAFGINRVWHPEVGTTFWLDRAVDGIGYWNEDMSRFSNDLDALAPPQYGYANSEMIEDVNYIGWMQDVDGDGEVTLNTDIYSYQQVGPSNMPSIHVDDDGFIHVLFVSTTETYEVTVGDLDFNYKHLWYRTTRPPYGAGPGNWSPFFHLTEDISHIFDESYYPIIADFDETTGTLHYIYNIDITPGLAWSSDHDWQTNNIIYGAFMFPVGIDEAQGISQLPVNVSPNPVMNVANFKIDLENATPVRLILTDLHGQEVRKADYGLQASGVSNIAMDLSDLPAGIYFYRVVAGNASATGKLIRQ